MGAQEDFDMFSSLAERLQLEEEDAEKFVSSSMKRLGHKIKVTWEDGDGSDGNDDGDFFGGKKTRTRSTGDNTKKRGSGGRGWQYGQ